MAQYEKPFLNIDEQIALLESRGLAIDDKNRAKFFLKNISYYHLSVYAKALQNKDDKFVEGASFEDILGLYNFDKKLRLLLLDILERIEMSFKCVLAYEITKSKSDNYWYAKEENYINNDKDITKLLTGIKESREIYIRHYFEKYTEPKYPPAWMFFESLSFGDCKRLAKNLFEADRQIIAGFYKLSKGATIAMFGYLAHLRNACAHHSRVWNRGFTVSVAKYPKYREVFGDARDNSLYSYIVVIQILLQKINPTSSWLVKLETLINDYNIPLYRMGFPSDWRKKLEIIK